MKKSNSETLRHLKTNKGLDIKQIIIKYNLNENIDNNQNYFFFIKKLRRIILLSIILSIIISLIFFLIFNYRKRNNRKLISLKRNVNNTDDIDGYYIPKDISLNPYYKKCSVVNCKKCYGNSYNDICLSCLNFYIPLKNEKK